MQDFVSKSASGSGQLPRSFAAGGQPDALLATPKGVPTPPPQGQNWVSIPAAAFCRRKGKVSGSPGFAKPGADQGFDPPALFAVTATPLAFEMIGDFPLRIAEEIPIPVSIQILTSSLVFQGGLPPVFRRIFALCPVFVRWVGQLLYPRGESGTQGRQWVLLFFTVVVCTVAEVYFQLQTGISQVLQRLLGFRFSTAEETKQYRCDTSVTAL